MGFALQDFSSVLSMGGKNALGRALMGTMNNVQMLGAAFGPWGIAVTAAAGALGSILIPELLKGEEATENFSKAIEKSEAALDRLVSKERASIGFAKNLERLRKEGSVDQVKSAIEDNSAEIEATKQELARRRAELRTSILGAGAQRGLVGYDPNKPFFDAQNRLLQQNVGINTAVVGEAAASRIEAQGEKVRDLEDTLTRQTRRKAALEGAMPAARENDFIRELGKQQEKDLHQLEQMREKRFTPLEKMQAGLADLAGLNRRLPGSEQIIMKGMDSLFEEFARDLPKAEKRLAPAMLKGSAEAMSAITRAKMPDTQRDQQLAEAKKQIAISKQQLTALNDIKNKIEPAVPVELRGG
jgi:hypothetical protein